MASLPPGADSDQVRAPFPTRVSKSLSRRHATYSPCAVLPFDWAASASQFALRVVVLGRPIGRGNHPRTLFTYPTARSLRLCICSTQL